MCKDEEQEERPTTFDDVLDAMSECNLEHALWDRLFGWEGSNESTVSNWVYEYARDQDDKNDQIKNRVEAALLECMDEKERQRLVFDVGVELHRSLSAAGVPFTLFGIALGLRMAGLEVDDIRARMRWLI